MTKRTAVWVLLTAALLFGCSDSSDAPSNTKTPKPTAQAPAPPKDRANAADWPMHLRDVNRSGAAAASDLAAPFKTDWTFKTGGRIAANPIVVKGVVYIGSTDRHLYALHADKWGEKWRYRAGGEIVYAAAYVDGTVVAADMSGKLTGLDAETGDKRWERPLKRWTSSPPISADGLIWIGLHPKTIAALNPLTGDTVSEQSGQAYIGGAQYYCRRGKLLPAVSATAARTAGSAEPVRANGLTIAAYGEGTMRAFDAEGALVWEKKIGKGFEAPPAVWGGRVYAPSIDGNLYALSTGDAEPTEPAQMVESIHGSAPTRAAPSFEAEEGPLFNVGMRVPFLEARNGWARVKDPNGTERWMAPGAWAAMEPSSKGASFQQNRIWCSIEEQLELPPGAERPVWSPDGKRAAFFMRAHTGNYWRASSVWLYDAESGFARRAASGALLNPRLSWSPDSRWAAFEIYEEEGPGVWFTNAEGGKPRKLINGEAPAWSPIRHQLAFIQHQGDEDALARINSNGTELVYPAHYALEGRAEDYRPHTLPAWSPDGTRIAYATGGKYYEDGKARIAISGVKANSKKSKILTSGKRIYALAWSPDGAKIACEISGHRGGSANDPSTRRIAVYWADDETKHGIILPHRLPTWIDGSRLAYAQRPTTAGDQTRIWVVDADARETFLALKTDLKAASLQWMESRQRLAVWTTERPTKDRKLQPAKTRCWLTRISDKPQY